MHTHPVILLVALAGLTGCGQVANPDEPPTTTASTTKPSAATTVVAVTVATPTTALATTTTARPTTTTRVLSRAEATSKLCAAVAEADERIQGGKLVSGGLSLGGGISATERTADPAVVSAARSMLRAGLDGNPDGYLTARQAATAACARAGSSLPSRGPIQCIQAPCP